MTITSQLSAISDEAVVATNDRPPLSADSGIALQVALTEAQQHQLTLSASHRLLNLLGTLLPLAACLLLVPLGFNLPTLARDRWAFLFLAFVAILGLLLHFTWTDFINLVRYKYSVLYPRLFSLADHLNWTNFLEHTSPRSLSSWLPAFLYNAIAALVLVAVWIRFLLVPAKTDGGAEAWTLCLLGAACICSVFLAAEVTLISARTLERDIKFSLGRVHHPSLPFCSALQLVPLGDRCRYMLARELTVELSSAPTQRVEKIVIPRGFSTDLASVPRVFWPAFPPWEQYGPAALLHDYLYSLRTWDRKRCDRVFREVMQQLGVGSFTRNVIYFAVRLGGTAAKRSAECRRHPDEATQERILNRFRHSDQNVVYARRTEGAQSQGQASSE